jgi:hypothetical protein
MPAWTLRRDAAALLGYVCVAVAFTWPLPRQLSSALLGPPEGDTGVYIWNLWVFRHEIVEHARLPFFTFEILALTSPVPLVLHNYTTFANILAFPFLSALGVVSTYNLLIVCGGVMTAFAMYLYVKARIGDPVGAWIGGLMFGFSAYMSARAMGHFSLMLAAPIPVFAWLLYRIATQPTTRLACAAGVVVAWAFLCDPYYAVYCLMMTAFMAVHSILVLEQKPASVRRRWWPAVLDLAIICLGGLIVGVLLRGGGQVEVAGLRVSMTRLYTPVLVLTLLVAVRVWLLLRPRIAWNIPPLTPYARSLTIAGFVCALLLSPVLYAVGSPFAESNWISPQIPWRSSQPGVDLLAFVMPNPLHPLVGDSGRAWLASLPNGFVENTAAIPWMALGTILVAAAALRFRPPAAWVAFTICFAILAVGPFVRIAGYSTFIPTPWALLRYVPVIGAARVPTRMTILVLFGVSMLLAMAIQHLRKQSPKGNVIAAVVAILLLAELLPAPRTLHSAEVPSVYRMIAADPRPLRVLTLPFGLRDGLMSRGDYSAAYQFYQTVHEKPLIGGYVSRLPRRGVARYRRNFVMRVLLRLSEGREIEPEVMQTALERGPENVSRLQLGWVVVDRTRVAPALRQFAQDAFGLTHVTTEGDFELYRTSLAAPVP